MRRNRQESGFTLLEIAIAVAILGVAVVSSLQVFGSAMQLARAAARRSEAVVHARALMDAALTSPELLDEQRHGDIGDGYRWERSIRRAGPEDGVDNTQAAFQSEVRLAVVSVVVSWNEPNGAKSYRIGTMRIVPNND